MTYLGTKYSGWQLQKNVLSVQYFIEKALSLIGNESIGIFCAGRTDTGVHAINQVIHFNCLQERKPGNWMKGVNNFLPKDIRITWCQKVDESFHARFKAISRTYNYVIYNSSYPNIIWQDRCLQEHRILDVDKMNQAAKLLLGEHDFSSFRASGCQAQSPLKNIIHIEATRHKDWIVFAIQANSFLYHMVRNMMGSLIEVGLDKSVEWFEKLIEEKDRKLAAMTAPAQGLYFIHADFPATFSIPENQHKWDWYAH